MPWCMILKFNVVNVWITEKKYQCWRYWQTFITGHHIIMQYLLLYKCLCIIIFLGQWILNICFLHCQYEVNLYMFIACKKNYQIKYICEEYVHVIQQMSCSTFDKKCYIYPLLFVVLVSVIYFFVYLGCLFCRFAIIFIMSVAICFGIFTVAGVGRRSEVWPYPMLYS